MKNTTDLWLATYIIRQGVPLHDYKLLGPRKVSFAFKVDDADWKKLKMDYLNSDIVEFEKAMEKLKDIAYNS